MIRVCVIQHGDIMIVYVLQQCAWYQVRIGEVTLRAQLIFLRVSVRVGTRARARA